MQIILEKTEVLEFIYNALCNSLGYIRGYGLELQISQSEYQAAKESLTEEDKSEFQKRFNSKWCYEDVLKKHLANGHALQFRDLENHEDASFTLDEAIERLNANKDIADHLLAMANENDDAETGDCILQTCLYGKVIFG